MGAAHEFWLWPEPLSAPAGSSTRLTLKVGEFFEGDPVPFAAQYAAALRRYSNGGVEDILRTARLARPRGELRLDLPQPGTHLLAYDSQPTAIILQADKFHAYLHDEGLDEIVARRVDAGTASLPGRERYRRCVKSLVRVGEPDATYAVRSGQRLEIVPLSDPLATDAGEPLAFRLLFDDQPVAGRLVKAWHKRDGQTVVIRAYSDKSGQVSFNLPYRGGWMVSFVHMIAATDSSAVDWDSFWGSITFELRGRFPA